MPDNQRMYRPARTLLEQLIRERRQTLEEFVEYAEAFAREHDEPGTLGVRHLQRLISGKRSDGRPLGPVKPTTARLLERIFNVSVDELLSVPAVECEKDAVGEIWDRLRISRRVDHGIVDLLGEQLSAIRRLDRQLGARVAHDEVLIKIEQVTQLRAYSLRPAVRESLAAILSELCMLAGWQALDLGDCVRSWQFYERAKVAAIESRSKIFEVHSAAQQAFVLIDVEKPAEAVDLLDYARRQAAGSSTALLRSWLAAAYGEALAANNERFASLKALDEAISLLPNQSVSSDGPYVALDSTHLDRWRGHALSRLGEPVAVELLTGALGRLDSSFTRAETALRADLAIVFAKIGERREARLQADHASRLASEIGSTRQLRRVRALLRL